MYKYERIEGGRKESIVGRTWKRMKADTKDVWSDWKEAFKPVPKKKDVNLSRLKNPKWNDSETKCLDTLIQGGFGPLKLISNFRTKAVALEKVVKKDMTTLETFKESVLCLNICKEESHFLKIIAVSETTEYYSLYLKNFSGTPISSLDGNKMEPWMLCTIVSHIGKALRCLHSKGILHRNITGSNILINESLQVKVTGFELAKITKESSECVGTVGYMSPETINHNYKLNQIFTGTTDLEKTAQLSTIYDKYGMEADYFSLGAVIFDLFFYNPPSFLNLDNIEAAYKDDAILLNMYECTVSYPTSDTTGNTFFVFKDLIEGLLRKEPKHRLSGKSFKKHPVFSDVQTSPNAQNVVNLQCYLKPISEINKASTYKVISNPSLEFLINTDTQQLEDIFLYLATRPKSFPLWQSVLQEFYPQKYGIYKAKWDYSHSSSTLSKSISLGLPWTPEEDENPRPQNFFPTLSESSVHSEALIEVMETESEVPDLLLNPTVQDLQLDHGFLSSHTSRSSSAASFHTPATRCTTDTYCFCCSPENEAESICESTTAFIETEETADTEQEPQDDFFISVILWISFIILCIIFLGKSLYSVAVVKKKPGENNVSPLEERSEDK